MPPREATLDNGDSRRFVLATRRQVLPRRTEAGMGKGEDRGLARAPRRLPARPLTARPTGLSNEQLQAIGNTAAQSAQVDELIVRSIISRRHDTSVKLPPLVSVTTRPRSARCAIARPRPTDPRGRSAWFRERTCTKARCRPSARSLVGVPRVPLPSGSEAASIGSPSESNEDRPATTANSERGTHAGSMRRLQSGRGGQQGVLIRTFLREPEGGIEPPTYALRVRCSAG
jgi:hypothetical protein